MNQTTEKIKESFGLKNKEWILVALRMGGFERPPDTQGIRVE
jgi:hypothetical protein